MGCDYKSALVSTFYLILNLDLVSKMALVVGQSSDSELYAKEAGKICMGEGSTCIVISNIFNFYIFVLICTALRHTVLANTEITCSISGKW